MGFSALPGKKIIKLGLVSLAAFGAPFFSATETPAKVVIEKRVELGVIKGIVRDEQGNPISSAVVAVFRVGTSRLLKQVYSSGDGSFLAKVLPGTYTVLAVAEGFNPTTVAQVEVNRSTELTYGFKLERSGGGNTLPEKRPDRNNLKWTMRAAQSRRSVYQHQEGATPIDESPVDVDENIGAASDEAVASRRSQTVVETYFANSIEGSYQGFNFATIQPLGESTEIIVSGQTGTKSFAPNRIETTLKARPLNNHQIRLTTSAAKVGTIKQTGKQLGQISLQGLDEWTTRSGVILVLGFDYSRFVGGGNAASLSPRLGLQFDAGSKTRFHAAYTTQNEERDWSHAIELEDNSVIFRTPMASPEIAVEDEKPLMNKSRRLEFGVERVLDNSSSVEATAFFDAVSGRGVGLVNLPANFLSQEGFEPFTVSQQGTAQGVRVVYTRRFGKTFSASAGYSFGRGQQLSLQEISSPANVFKNSYFQSFAGQFNTDLRTGTQIKTIFRLSPEATVFAIDPFQGRLAIYDPSLSVLITQPLPNLGLPIHAEALIDARNLFDYQSSAGSEQGSLRLNSQRRTLRGGIMVRF